MFFFANNDSTPLRRYASALRPRAKKRACKTARDVVYFERGSLVIPEFLQKNIYSLKKNIYITYCKVD